jgi:hypothetical protein
VLLPDWPKSGVVATPVPSSRPPKEQWTHPYHSHAGRSPLPCPYVRFRSLLGELREIRMVGHGRNLYAGYGHYFSLQKCPLYMHFRRRLILRIAAASPSRFSACDRPPACVASCLVPREGATYTRPVDVKRAPFPAAASRLTIESSNARVPPLIRPYPPSHHALMRYMSHPPRSALASRCLVLIYKVAICHPST